MKERSPFVTKLLLSFEEEGGEIDKQSLHHLMFFR